jgi:hypothetical protein
MAVLFRRRFVLLLPLVVLGLLGGCASKFTADVTRFHDLPPVTAQTIEIVAKNPAMQDTLEFQKYADMVGARLAAEGYRPPEAGTPSDYIAGIDFGVGEGRQALRDDEGGSSVGVGVGGGSRGGLSVGVSTAFMISGGGNDTVYVRRLYMDLTRRSDGVRVFEGRAVSEGRTPDLAKIMPYLLDALFTDFPGKSGETREIKLDVSEDGPEKY